MGEVRKRSSWSPRPSSCSRCNAMLELLRTEPEAAAVFGFIRANAQVNELTRQASLILRR